MKKHSISIDEEEISAVHIPDESEEWVFLCHGFADTKERSMLPLAKMFKERGFNAVVFDFRGNGESSRDFREATLTSRIEDLRTVIDFFDPGRCFIYGTSFGAKVTYHAASTMDGIDAIVTKAPVTYNEIMDKFRKVVEEKGEAEFYGKKFDQSFFDDLDGYGFEDVVRDLDVPVAIFHGGEDTTVHPRYSFRAAEELHTDLSLNMFEGQEHSFTDEATERMVEISVTWLNSLR